MGYIFVSYAWDDSQKVNRIIHELKSLGFEFWRDVENIESGKDLREEITRVIQNCSKFLLCLSAASMISDNVKREVQLAYENKKKIIILRLEDQPISPSLRYQLAGIQWTDYSSADWKPRIVIAIGDGKKSLPKTKKADTPKPEVSTRVVRRSRRSLRIFLCHASADKPSVKSLYDRLVREENLDPWLDQVKLLPGQNWDMEIRKAVSETDVILVCLSNQSINKEGYVQKEIKLALDVGDEKLEGEIFLIPVKLEECKVPTRLSTWQWLNYFEEGAYERLLQSLQKRAAHFGIKISQENSKSRYAPLPPKSSNENREPSINASKIGNTYIENNKNFFILQHSMLQQKAATRNVSNISRIPADAQVDLFCETLKELEEYLDTGDLRKLTETSLGVIRDDVLEIIKGLRNLQGSHNMGLVRSFDGILQNLRVARDGLQTSLAMFDASGHLNETKSKKLFAELRNVRETIAKALRSFK